jgi:hypothetical protein
MPTAQLNPGHAERPSSSALPVAGIFASPLAKLLSYASLDISFRQVRLKHKFYHILALGSPPERNLCVDLCDLICPSAFHQLPSILFRLLYPGFNRPYLAGVWPLAIATTVGSSPPLLSLWESPY